MSDTQTPDLEHYKNPVKTGKHVLDLDETKRAADYWRWRCDYWQSVWKFSNWNDAVAKANADHAYDKMIEAQNVLVVAGTKAGRRNYYAPKHKLPDPKDFDYNPIYLYPVA